MHPCAREKVGQLLYLASVGLVGIRRTTMGKRICSQDTTKQESELETAPNLEEGNDRYYLLVQRFSSLRITGVLPALWWMFSATTMSPLHMLPTHSFLP